MSPEANQLARDLLLGVQIVGSVVLIALFVLWLSGYWGGAE